MAFCTAHHAYTDTELDPHSPSYDDNLFAMMWRTKTYAAIMSGTSEVEDKFTKNVPSGPGLTNGATAICHVYSGYRVHTHLPLFAPSLWWFLLIPVHAVMGLCTA